jgi:putative membrane protein
MQMTNPRKPAGLALALTLGLSLALSLAPAARAQGTAPSDAQIAAIVVTANQVDIDAGKLAEGKGRSKEVKDFARQMVTDHTSVNKSATDLAGKLKLTPEDNPTAQGLKKGGEANLARLRKLDGAAFDKAYVDNEVAYHQAVIDAVDKTLIPSAKNEELKALLVKVRPAFVAHLEHAKYMQATLGKSGG